MLVRIQHLNDLFSEFCQFLNLAVLTAYGLKQILINGVCVHLIYYLRKSGNCDGTKYLQKYLILQKTTTEKYSGK